MIQVQKVAKMFAKVKPLKLSVLATEPEIKIKSLTTDKSWDVVNPLQSVLSALVGCELHTFKDFARREKLTVHNVKVNKVEGSYQLQRYMKGGSDNHISNVTIDIDVETDGTQEDLDKIHKKVQNSCPVYQMLKTSGVDIKNNWKNIQKKKE